MFYPALSQWYSKMTQTAAIRRYVDSMEKYDEEEKKIWLEEARMYNENLWTFFSKLTADPGNDDERMEKLNYQYASLLDPDHNGIMGTIHIPQLDIRLPILHGTDEDVLSRGAGHLQNTSLPVGGNNTHCVVSAHTGFPRAAMFDRLVEMKEGDLFYLKVLEQELAYRVINITLANPYDFTGLMIQDGKDLCTLVTCYPYGINSHRLLVTGMREEIVEPEELAVLHEPIEEFPFLYVGIGTGGGVVLVTLVIIVYRRKRRLKWKKPFAQEY